VIRRKPRKKVLDSGALGTYGAPPVTKRCQDCSRHADFEAVAEDRYRCRRCGFEWRRVRGVWERLSTISAEDVETALDRGTETAAELRETLWRVFHTLPNTKVD